MKKNERQEVIRRENVRRNVALRLGILAFVGATPSGFAFSIAKNELVPAVAIEPDPSRVDPGKSPTGKALLTFNKMGFDTTSVASNWVTEAILKQCREIPSLRILDVGAGFGGVSIAALQLGATVIANDIDQHHLQYIFENTSANHHERLYLNFGNFTDTFIQPNSLDAIVLHRVLHFMPGRAVENSLKKAATLLKPGGKIYIVVLSPTHSTYKQRVLPSYLVKQSNGHRWPGEGIVSADALPEQAYNLPATIHVMDKKVLARSLEENGFRVLVADFVSHKAFGSSRENRDGKENVGMIATKILMLVEATRIKAKHP